MTSFRGPVLQVKTRYAVVIMTTSLTYCFDANLQLKVKRVKKTLNDGSINLQLDLKNMIRC